jgi:uncharacterized membrane protein YedE/YeeE
MSGESEHARAAALALLLSMIGFTILKSTDLKDAGEWVFPSFWLGALLGGSVFGIGMVIAGGCGAGSLWRAGEGHIKLWVAVLFFAMGAATMRLFLTQTELIGQLGSAIFLPNLVGWRAQRCRCCHGALVCGFRMERTTKGSRRAYVLMGGNL